MIVDIPTCHCSLSISPFYSGLMTEYLTKSKLIKELRKMNREVKYQGPLIRKMFGMLNQLQLRNENRYILCNFIDKYGDLMDMSGDIYVENNQRTLNRLFLMAYNGARNNSLLDLLFEEYKTSLEAITMKKEYLDV